MIQFLINLLIFLVSVLLLVTVHEFGHFWVARRLGVKVVRFSVGFGRPLVRWCGREGTEYVIALLPLGGYVRLLDERDGGEVSEEDKPRAFNRQSVFKRMLIVLAGPGINVVFAILAFWLMWMIGVERVRPVIGEIVPKSIAEQSGIPRGAEIVSVDGQPTVNWSKINIVLISRVGDSGDLLISARKNLGAAPQTYTLRLNNWSLNGLQPDPVKSLGIIPYQPNIPPVIGVVSSGTPAADAGLHVGDRVLTIAGQKVTNWTDILNQIYSRPGQTVQITLERGQQQITLNVNIGRKLSRFKWTGYIGVAPVAVTWPSGMKYQLKYSSGPALLQSLYEIETLAKFNFVVLAKMVKGQVSTQSLGGPISIYQTSSFAFQQGLVIYIGFLGLLSLMLALVNILPIPGLDGGHILFFVIEGIIRRPLSPILQILIIRLGFLFLILIMMQATLNDIFRSFSNS